MQNQFSRSDPSFLPPRSVEPSAALRAYLQILRDAPTLEDATLWAETHPLRSLTPTVADPVPWASEAPRPLPTWVTSPRAPLGGSRDSLGWLKARNAHWQGPPPHVPPPSAPLHLRRPVACITRIARHDARRAWWRRLLRRWGR